MGDLYRVKPSVTVLQSHSEDRRLLQVAVGTMDLCKPDLHGIAHTCVFNLSSTDDKQKLWKKNNIHGTVFPSC